MAKHRTTVSMDEELDAILARLADVHVAARALRLRPAELTSDTDDMRRLRISDASVIGT